MDITIEKKDIKIRYNNGKKRQQQSQKWRIKTQDKLLKIKITKKNSF